MSHRKSKNKRGRPTKLTADVLQKLEDAFTNALTDEEACLYAGIAPRTLYNYQERNPKFVQRKEILRLTPNIAARKTIVNALGDPNHAWRWIEKKDPDMRPVNRIEHSGKIQVEEAVTDPEVLEAIKVYEKTREKQIRERIKAGKTK